MTNALIAALSIALPPPDTNSYWETNSFMCSNPFPGRTKGYFWSLETNGIANTTTIFTMDRFLTVAVSGTNSYTLLSVFPFDGTNLLLCQYDDESVGIQAQPFPYYDLFWLSSPATIQVRSNALTGSWATIGTFNETNLTFSTFDGPMKLYRISPPQKIGIRLHY